MVQARFCLLLFNIVFVCQLIVAQDNPDVTLHGKLALNPNVKFGRLENGFQYYILKTSDSIDAIAINLVVDAGNFDEESDQFGLAHFVEHLGTRSTTHFPGGGYQFLRSNGISANASTGSVTDYHLRIPLDKIQLLDSAILLLSDCAGGISFLADEVEEERSAVLREAANGNSRAFFSLKETTYLLLDENHRYANMLPLQSENVKTARIESLIRFYHEWYHPIYQTLFVVGNVDIEKTEGLIGRYFSGFSNAGAKAKADLNVLLDIPLRSQKKLVVVEHGATDTSITVEIFKKRKAFINAETLGTRQEIKIALSFNLVNAMLEHRLKVLKPTNSFLPETFYVDQGAIATSANIDAIHTHQVVKNPTDAKKAIQSAAVELYRLEKFGFSKDEFNRAKEMLFSSLKKSKRNQRSNFELLRDLIEHHHSGHVFPANGIDLKIEMIEEIALVEINDMVMSWLRTEGNEDIVLSVPVAGGPGIPTEVEAFAWMDEARRDKITRYHEPKTKSLPVNPKNNVQSKFTIEKLQSIDAVRLKFENGATVIIKSFQNDGSQEDGVEIQGLNRYSSQRLSELRDSGALLKDAGRFIGVSKINAAELAHIKAEKKVHVIPVADNGQIKIIGSSKATEAETLLHLIYLYMTEPTLDAAAFKRYGDLQVQQGLLKRTPGQVYDDTIDFSMGRAYVVPKPIVSYSKERLRQLVEEYNYNYGNASEFAFVITGHFDQQEMIRLAAKYIGSLIGSGNAINKPKPTAKRTSNRNFKSGDRVTLVGDSVNNVDVCILFRGRPIPDMKDELALQVVNKALSQLLFVRLRQKEKGVYGTHHNLRMNNDSGFFLLDVRFSTEPKDVERLIEATKDELHQLRSVPLDNVSFANGIKKVKSEIEEETTSSYYWTTFLLECEQKNDFSGGDQQRKIEILDSLKPSDISNAMHLLDVNSYMIFKLL